MFKVQPNSGFEEDLVALRTLVAEPVHSAEALTRKLENIYSYIFNIDFGKYDVSHVSGTARDILQSLFDLRMHLRDDLAAWKASGYLVPDAEKALRNVFRVLRYASDIFGELAVDHLRAEEDEQSFKAFTGPHLNTLVHAKYGSVGELTFEAGDVILVRGTAHNSAAIARIGDIDSQFSHVGMVYVDDVGTRMAVEAIIEEGSLVRPIDEMLDHGNVRAILFRHRDRALAKRAADLMYEHVKMSMDGDIAHIPYDFTMKLDGEKELFCSKLVRLAYLKASDGEYVMPDFQTKLSLKNRDFVNRIGVEVDETFAPGDMELESSFDLVAEWRDYRFTSKVRLQDMVMTKVLEWMEDRKYKFKQRFPIGLISFFGKLSAYLSRSAKELLKDVLPVVPRNMKRKTIAAVIMMHKTAEPILQKMIELEDDHISKTGHQLHPRDVLIEAEKIRKASGRRIGYLVGPVFRRD